MFREAFRNSCHQSNTSNPNLPSILLKLTFIFKSLQASSQYNDSDICWKICCSNHDRSKRSISSQKHSNQFQCPTSLQIQLFSLAVKWPVQTVWSNTSVYTQAKKSVELHLPSNSLPAWHIFGQLYLNLLPMYISLNRSHPFWSYKGTLLYITHPSHAHYMTHLFHLHWSNHINIMKSSNNKPHYIIFCVLQLLTPSIVQIISWKILHIVTQNMLFLQCDRSHFRPM
jgi:hypothetical protein